MDVDFWQQKWEKNEIGFHEAQPNPLLVAHFKQLALAPESRVFLPLCGKTLDIAWLLSQGCRVVGAELSQLAIEQLFDQLGIEADIIDCGKYSRYSGRNIDVFVGDIFVLSSAELGPVDAIYDRAALVALPEAMRYRYTRHLRELSGSARQLLITFEYDQSRMEGPPFSIAGEEVLRHYADAYQVTALASQPVTGGLKAVCPATETVWLLHL